LASNEEWIVNVWKNLLGSNPKNKIAQLKADYKIDFESKDPNNPVDPSNEDQEKFKQNLSLLDNIALNVGKRVGDIDPNVLKQMSDLLPLVIKLKRGEAIAPQLTPLEQRGLKKVSGQDNRCWLRSSWAAAVDALPQEQFTARVLELARSMRDHEIFNREDLFGKLDLNLVEVDQIYLQIQKDVGNGLSTPDHYDDNFSKLKKSERLDSTPPGPMDLTIEDKMILERKQRALMIAVVDKADKLLKNTDVEDTLQELKNGMNLQAEQEFGALFLNALGLPVIIHSTSTSVPGDQSPPVPDVRLPENFNVVEHGHPDTWPTIFHKGGALGGHYDFYQKHIKTERAAI
jgi:hypothetical protein